jgi:two-component system, LytTR family, response regulator LytT
MIGTLIIEDEEPAAVRLKKLLKSLAPDIEILGTIDTVEAAVNWFNNHPQPDLVMLDIQLGDGLSFEIFRKTVIDSYIIFTTAYDEYAIKAFELNSIDYLLKPVDETRLSVSLQKFRKLESGKHNFNINKLLEEIENRKDSFKKRFVVSIANKIKVVETGDVAYFYSKEKNTFLCTRDNKHYPLEFSLDHISELLNPEIFFRINRQYIANFNCINKIDILSKSRIRIETNPPSGEEILVSTSKTSEFRSWLER